MKLSKCFLLLSILLFITFQAKAAFRSPCAKLGALDGEYELILQSKNTNNTSHAVITKGSAPNTYIENVDYMSYQLKKQLIVSEEKGKCYISYDLGEPEDLMRFQVNSITPTSFTLSNVDKTFGDDSSAHLIYKRIKVQ